MHRNILTALLLSATAFGAETIPSPAPVTAHEWGTFTSIADRDGNPVRWFALGGPAKLPCFVHTFRSKNMYTFVRMETPVIYFYAPRKTTLSVSVNFVKGLLTEWYPAARDETSSLTWDNVQVLPEQNLTFPSGQGNHYYTARATDAAPLRIGKEQEKMIFYRGVGDMDVPVRPRFTAEGRIELRTTSSQPIPTAILFENRDGKVGFLTLHSLHGVTTIDPPELNANGDAVRTALTADLVQAGLYPKEAQAMIETWRDSWFEPGLRIIYIVPRATADAVLPLTITPAASEVARVFVGRVEMLSPAMIEEIELGVKHEDRGALAKYGRFLEGFWQGLHGYTSKLPAGLVAQSPGGCAN
jgi:hypothetical protein